MYAPPQRRGEYAAPESGSKERLMNASGEDAANGMDAKSRMANAIEGKRMHAQRQQWF
jgi:hypothetical protein